MSGDKSFQRLGLFTLCAALSTALYAHSADRGFILLLPTRFMIAGGTLAVAASILLVAFTKPAFAEKLASWQISCALPAWRWQTTLSLFSLLCLLTLILAGLLGSTDPLGNPLPLSVWTLGWVLLTLLHAKFGYLWRYLNPWTGLITLLTRLSGRQLSTGCCNLPAGLGYLPAIAGFALIAWFELVSLAPEDPPSLARVIFFYWLAMLLMALLFGEKAWFGRGEPVSVFFRFIALLSPFSIQREKSAKRLYFALPGTSILKHKPLHWTGAFFVLLTLATVSFDGLNKTFWWFQINNINPLAFEGRSTVKQINSVGLVALFVSLCATYLGTLWIGWRLTAKKVLLVDMIGQLALALLPISLVYHFSHFLTQILVNLQYSAKAFSDPFNTGANLLGFKDMAVSTSFLSHHSAVEIIWLIQLLAVVGGHVISAVLAHMLALRLFGSHRAAVMAQSPLAFLMILYTLFGLWLLSTATGI